MAPNSFTILLLFILIVINTGALICMGLLLNYFKKLDGKSHDEN